MIAWLAVPTQFLTLIHTCRGEMDENLAVSSYAIFNPLSHMSRRDVLDNLAGSSYAIFNPISHISWGDG
jgi:hypothetical protein